MNHDTAADGGESLAEIRDVTHAYGGVPVLRSASLAVGPGVTAVVGPNGSGKSTLLRILAGETAPVEGTVRYTGPDVQRPVGYLPQDVPFRGSFTARETLAFYARLVDADPDARLETVGLADAAARRVDALSGGMRRLLGIAQATLGDPPVVVLDEPTSGLDPGMRERAFELAADHAADAAVVVSSHDLGLVDAHADGIVVLHRGRVAAAGGRAALLDRYGVNDSEELYRAVVDGDPDPEGEDPDDDASDRVHVAGVSDR
ncbi:ABC transporter ATP-binding protein [Halorubrum luteum]